MKQIGITELKDSVKNLYSLTTKGKRVAAMIWGAPGVGKSAGVRQSADELGVDFIDLRLSLLNPVDLRGLPMADRETKKAMWLPPEFLPKDGKGILFLDEINLAPQSVMAAGYQLILDGRLGEYILPKGWMIVAAGNRTEDNAATTRFPAPLANRFVHFEVKLPDVDEWRKWAITSGVDEKIVTFLSRMPQHLYRFPKQGDQSKSWPSPRSWEFASMLYEARQDIASAVGEGVGAEFYTFIKVYDKMPDIQLILAGKGENERVPDHTKELDVLWATTMALVYRVKPDKSQVSHLFEYITRKEFPTEFQALTLTSLDERGEEMATAIRTSQGWKEWIKKNKDVFDES